jgi:hypothetical protein
MIKKGGPIVSGALLKTIIQPNKSDTLATGQIVSGTFTTPLFALPVTTKAFSLLNINLKFPK